MNVFRELTDKPWIASEGAVVERQGGGAFALPSVKVGLRLFLVMASVLFTLVVAVYAGRLALGGWDPMPEPWRLWLNTAMLVASSMALQWARVSANRGQIDGVTSGLLAGGVLALAFVIGQVLAWQQLTGQGYLAATNPSVAFFYMITGLHGVHLLGGLVACGAAPWLRSGGVDLRRPRCV